MKPELCDPLAEDLDALIRLHDRELDAETVTALKVVDFPMNLALLPEGPSGDGIVATLRAALGELEAPPTTEQLDLLAADFAAIYLNSSYGSSPYESVWVTDEHLVAQQPMFEWRQLLADDGFEAGDWRRRYDDHLVLQLQWLQGRLRRHRDDWEGTAAVLDEHLLYWLVDWALRVEARADTPFYAGLAGLTVHWLQRFRELLADMFDLKVPPRAEVAAKVRAKFKVEAESIAPIKFMPGVNGPSW